MKKALLVGINKYAIPNSDLRGCVNDVTNMKNILANMYGFDEINVLTDYQATTKGIKDSLNALVAGARAGDTVLFHYSGHGSQTTDLNADEPDGVDEIICPHDLNWQNNMITDDYLNSVFKKLSSAIQLVILSDSCHSGSLLRNMIGVKNQAYNIPRFIRPPEHVAKKIAAANSGSLNLENKKAECLKRKEDLENELKKYKEELSSISSETKKKKDEYEKLKAEYEKGLAKNEKLKKQFEKENKKNKDKKQKSLELETLKKPELNIDFESAKEKEYLEKIEAVKSSIYANDAEMGKISDGKVKVEDFNKRNGILLSGCESTQTSADAFMDGKYQGAFTCILTKILQSCNYNITYARLITEVNKMMDRLGYSQNPQLECPDNWKGRKFLG